MREEVFPRYAKYPYHGAEDVDVVPIQNNEYLVLYGSTAEVTSAGATTSSAKKKSRSEIRDKMDYGIMNQDGVIEKRTMVINEKDTPKNERKLIDNGAIVQIDGQAYVFSTSRRIKVSAILIRQFTLGVVNVYRGSAWNGQFFLGKIRS